MNLLIQKLQKMLLKDEAALITSNVNRRYFTGFSSSAGVLIVCKEEAYLLVDFRYIVAARQSVSDIKVIQPQKFDDTIKEIFTTENIKKVHMEADSLSYTKFKSYDETFKSIGVSSIYGNAIQGMINSIRVIKSDAEIAKMQEAQDITDKAFDYILDKIKVGVTEREIALDIEFFMRKNGAERIAFDLIVVAGKKGSMCHGVPDDNKINEGDFVTMDIGAVVDGYHSDMTRTVAVGFVSDEQRDVYETVLDAHLKVLEALKPGACCSDMDKIARDIIDKNYEGYFGHSLGHGVGFEIHEDPTLGSLSKGVLETGMVVTDEPGIYIPDKFGCRIEDMVLITQNSCKSFAKSPKNLIIL